MALFKQWQEKLEKQNEAKGGDEFFQAYLEMETEFYKGLLAEKRFMLEGTITALAAEAKMDEVTFVGFLDGANTSFENEINLEDIEADSVISATLIPETLYYNMMVAKANWLYALPEWDSVLTDDQRKDIRARFNNDHRASSTKVGRNDPCPCGSGKKYKKCCMQA